MRLFLFVTLNHLKNLKNSGTQIYPPPSNTLLAFVRSGLVSLNDGKVYGVGRDLYGWSRVARSASVAYDLAVDPTEVYPSYSDSRWYAFPLRCLYLGSV